MGLASCVGAPAGGASVLRLAVNNGANGHTAGAAPRRDLHPAFRDAL